MHSLTNLKIQKHCLAIQETTLFYLWWFRSKQHYMHCHNTYNKSRQLWEIHKIEGSDQTKPQKFLAVDCKTTHFWDHQLLYHLTTTSMHFRFNIASTNVLFMLQTAFLMPCQSSATWVKITKNLWSCVCFLVCIRITFSCATAEMNSLITHPHKLFKG